MYRAIRDCNIFLENAHIPRDITELERARWIAEVKFLKAYYHFFLMELYGPIVLVKENLPLSATPEETKVYREPVDECVNYIVQLLDEAAAELRAQATGIVLKNGVGFLQAISACVTDVALESRRPAAKATQ